MTNDEDYLTDNAKKSYCFNTQLIISAFTILSKL